MKVPPWPAVAFVAAAALAWYLLPGPLGGPERTGTPAHVPVTPAPVATAPQPDCVRRKNLSVATGDDISAGSFRREVFRQWNEAHPDATLIEVSGGTDERRAQMAAPAQAGSCDYDVLILDVAWVAEFARLGYIQPIPFDTGGFLPALRKTAMVDGELYGVPFAADAPLEFQRTDVTDGLYALQLGDTESGTINLLEMIGMAGGHVVGGDESTDVTLGEERERTWRALSGWKVRTTGDQRVGVIEQSLDDDEDESLLAFRNGQTAAKEPVAYMRNWPIAFHRLAADPLTMRDPARKDALRFRVRALPGGVLGGSVLAVSRHTARLPEAMQLVRELTGHRAQAELFACGGYAPVLTSVYDAYAGAGAKDCAALLSDAKPKPDSEPVAISAAELSGLAAEIRRAIEGASGSEPGDDARIRPKSEFYARFSEAFRRCARGAMAGTVSEEAFFASAEMLREALKGRITAKPPC